MEDSQYELYSKEKEQINISLDMSKIDKVVSNTNKETMKDVYNMMAKIGEIPVVSIKNGNLIFEEKTSYHYLFNNDLVNKCKECMNNDNAFFCETCHENICQSCFQICAEKNHTLKNLKEEKNIYEKQKESIKTMLAEYSTKFNKKEKNSKEISKEKFDNIDIINKIIQKDYLNHFHFQNANKCDEYLKCMYEETGFKDCLQITYTTSNFKEERFKIFGQTFVENNKENIYLKINGDMFELVETVEKKEIINDHLEVIMIQKFENETRKYINNMSCMFCDCKATEIKFSKMKNGPLFDLSNVTDISKMFKNCPNLKEIDLKFLQNINEIKYMDHLFSGCKKLIKIIGINLINTESVKNMKKLFNACGKLEEIVGLKDMRTDNAEILDDIFNGCCKFKQLPDISGWKVDNVKSMKRLFKGCSKLKQLPDIGRWNVGNVKSMKGMFKGCSEIKELPDISGWNLENVISMKGMFKNCRALKSLPDLSKKKLKSLENIDKIFSGCTELLRYSNGKVEDFLLIENVEIISSIDALY